MRRIAILLTACIMLFPVSAAVPAEELKIIVCEEQGFSTLCADKYTYGYHPDEGISIYEDSPENEPYLTINKADSADFDAEAYFRNSFTPQVESVYGSSLIMAGEFKEYNLAGIPLQGQMCLYSANGMTEGRLCLFDVRSDSFIRYEVFFNENQADEAVSMIATAAAYYEPDPWYYYEPEDRPESRTEDPGPEPKTEEPEPEPEPQPEADAREKSKDEITLAEKNGISLDDPENEPSGGPGPGGADTNESPEPGTGTAAPETDIILFTYYQQVGWGDEMQAGFVDDKGGLWFLEGSASELNWPSNRNEQILYLEECTELESLGKLDSEDVFALKSLINASEAQVDAQASGANDAGFEYSYALRKDRDGNVEWILLGASGDDIMENTDEEAQGLYKRLRELFPGVTSYTGQSGMGPMGFEPVSLADFLGYDAEELNYATVTAYYEDCEAGPSEAALSDGSQLEALKLARTGMVTGKTSCIGTTGGLYTYVFTDYKGDHIISITLYRGDLYTNDGTYSIEVP